MENTKIIVHISPHQSRKVDELSRINIQTDQANEFDTGQCNQVLFASNCNS